MERNQPYMIERIVAATSYLTAGLVGFIWLLLGVFTKSNPRVFLRYHIFQSIFISMAYFLLCTFLGFIMNILSIIPFVGQILMQITFFFNAPLFGPLSILQVFIYAFIFYLTLTAFQGKFTYIPGVSDIIKSNIGCD